MSCKVSPERSVFVCKTEIFKYKPILEMHRHWFLMQEALFRIWKVSIYDFRTNKYYLTCWKTKWMMFTRRLLSEIVFSATVFPSTKLYMNIFSYNTMRTASLSNNDLLYFIKHGCCRSHFCNKIYFTISSYWWHFNCLWWNFFFLKVTFMPPWTG